DIAQMSAKAYRTNFDRYIGPAQIDSIIDLNAENKRVVIHIEYKGRETFVRTFDDPEYWPNETSMAAGFSRLLKEEMPLVVYSTGSLERSISRLGEREFTLQSSYIHSRYSLVNIGFDVDTVNLDVEDVPEKARFVVVADPKVEFSAAK